MDLLSICIPTYNRKDRLESLLNKVCKWNKKHIKIIVIDNASTDGTDTMMGQFAGNRDIIYLRNDKNLGHDGNYIRLVEEGKKHSRYSLWLGDDDCITEDFFNNIPLILEKYEPNLVLLNARPYINNILKRLAYKIGIKPFPQFFRLNADEIENNIIDFFKKYSNSIPFGITIIENNLIPMDCIQKYYGTYHLYAGAIWEMLNNVNEKKGNIKVYITSEVYVTWGKGDKTYKNINKDAYIGVGRTNALFPTILDKVVYDSIKKIKDTNYYGKYSDIIYDSYQKEKMKLSDK